MTTRSATRVAFVLGAVVVASLSLWGREGGSWGTLPTERVIANLEAYLSEHPDDVNSHYVLGRVYSFAYALNWGQVRAHVRKGHYVPENLREQKFWMDASMRRRSRVAEGRGESAPSMGVRDPALLLSYMEKGLHHLALALDGEPENAQYHLAYAYALETGAHVADHFDTPRLLRLEPAVSEELATEVDQKLAAREIDWLLAHADSIAPLLDQHRADADPGIQAVVRDLLRVVWARLAIVHYVRALDLSALSDAGVAWYMESQGEWLNTLISYEAATTILRIADADATVRVDSSHVERARAHVEKLKSIPRKPPQGISPIVFPLDGANSFTELLTSERVDFDLDGDGLRQNITWVKPSAAFLVWLGEGEEVGEIESGRQLFGSVTWWLFFENGYRALDALDDDRNGWLAGAELDGLGVWHDQNGDGVSEPDEVRSAVCHGIAAIRVVEDGMEGLSPTCSNGLVFESGEIVPTFDWVYFEPTAAP